MEIYAVGRASTEPVAGSLRSEPKNGEFWLPGEAFYCTKPVVPEIDSEKSLGFIEEPNNGGQNYVILKHPVLTQMTGSTIVVSKGWLFLLLKVGLFRKTEFPIVERPANGVVDSSIPAGVAGRMSTSRLETRTTISRTQGSGDRDCWFVERFYSFHLERLGKLDICVFQGILLAQSAVVKIDGAVEAPSGNNSDEAGPCADRRVARPWIGSSRGTGRRPRVETSTP